MLDRFAHLDGSAQARVSAPLLPLGNEAILNIDEKREALADRILPGSRLTSSVSEGLAPDDRRPTLESHVFSPARKMEEAKGKERREKDCSF